MAQGQQRSGWSSAVRSGACQGFMRRQVSLPSSIGPDDYSPCSRLCGRDFIVLKGVRYRPFESHHPSLLPRLLEGSFAQNGACFAHHTFLERGVWPIKIIDWSSDLPQRLSAAPIKTAERSASPPEGLRCRKRLQEMRQVGPILRSSGQLDPLPCGE